ncbi:hypothetical protein [Clostridium thailandense]|uniref:hypothetical protein n=1 Tax=Clostridium thailandense TaxID=2794346 RepID=UPI00398A002F
MFTGAGCSNSENANNTTEQQKPTATAQQKQTSTSNNKVSQSPVKLEKETVSRVVDGDTVEFSNGSKVRLIGVNTPELTTTTEPYGKEAS